MFVKLHEQIFNSSIMEEPVEVRYVWICLLALADQEGFIDMTVPAIARRINVGVLVVEKAIKIFLQPDETSRTPTNKGRRLEKIRDSFGWKIVNNVKEIKLTKGLISIVDEEDFEVINHFKWRAQKARGKFYAAREDYSNGKRTVLMHRAIINAPNNLEVDHINGDTLDNRRVNLRLATTQQNQFNKKYPYKNNKLGIKGVYWHKKCNKYQASIRHNHRTIYLGLFESSTDADKAYRDGETKYFGNFARHSAN